MKNKQAFLAVFVSILSLIVITVGGFYMWKVSKDMKNIDHATVDKSKYYALRSNATELQKELYSMLEKAIDDKASDEAVATLVAKNFVADFYTWSNKTKVTDVGGLQFVDAEIRTNVFHQAKETFYVALADYLKDGVGQKTLEVVEVSGDNGKNIDYTLWSPKDDNGDQTKTIVDAVEVHVTWKYKASTVLNVGEFDQEATVVLRKDDKGLYYIVEVNYVEDEA